ncbi:TPA: hypothetical protein RJR39_006317 [Burkholderia cenocepacia]|uniref:hypothetical protein n=1 Tax=Burkholderia cenocepacia TaxID=95486 RepID=UPI001B98525F|nr:hypothetical protein [Burkholderia cenocepacia]MBR8200200.1 hypothetical protein [Burkholderia cenocepacia]HDV6330180.1 hypothetical protein [Burkholderia cenocepacia]HDV6356002.1 hypothetical protein [Burkholderia cenocepacia]
MRQEFVGSVPKEPGSPEANEDALAIPNSSNRFALSDGASDSFDSKLWAKLLAHRFVGDPGVSPAWVDLVLEDYEAAHDFSSMSWSKQAAFERGSFATLLGGEYLADHHAVELLAVGDSVALLIDDDQLVSAWPFDDPERFQERPSLLSTVRSHNGFLDASDFWTRHGTTLHLDKLTAPRLLCMTDALGEWALRSSTRDNGDGLRDLASLRSAEQLTELVLRERATKRMRVDDSTLLVLSFERDARDGLSIS